MARGNAVRFGPPTVTSLGGQRARVQAPIHIGTTESTLWFEVPETAVPSENLADAFALAALLPAMRTGLPLHIEAPVSATLMANLAEVAAMYHMWFDDLAAVPITAPDQRDRTPEPATDRGLFFSGGVDSFHSALTFPAEIHHLVYVDALDTTVDDKGLLDRIRRAVHRSGEMLGLPVITVSTNVREVLDRYGSWVSHNHTLALAAIGHLLTGTLGRCVISADHSYRQLKKTCVNPMMVRHFGSDRLQVEPYGWKIPRVDRVAAIASEPAVMANLRVCWKNEGGAFNCGRCEKCLRTMADLSLAGALERCVTFDTPLDLGLLSAVDVNGLDLFEYVQMTRVRALEAGRTDIADALAGPINRAHAHNAAQRVGHDLALAAGSESFAAVVAENRDLLYRHLAAYQGRWLYGRVLRDLPAKVVTWFRTRLRRIRR